MALGDKQSRALRPDAQPFDEVRIVTVPRYKTSGLSGDEWRISATCQFLRKGRVVHEFGASNVQYALTKAVWEQHVMVDEGHAYFAGEGDQCDQEGCAEQAEVTYRRLRRYCDEPHLHGEVPEPDWRGSDIRKFCKKHSRRGDAAFDDADNNYELIEGETAEPESTAISPSVFGGIIHIDTNEAPR